MENLELSGDLLSDSNDEALWKEVMDLNDDLLYFFENQEFVIGKDTSPVHSPSSSSNENEDQNHEFDNINTGKRRRLDATGDCVDEHDESHEDNGNPSKLKTFQSRQEIEFQPTLSLEAPHARPNISLKKTMRFASNFANAFNTGSVNQFSSLIEEVFESECIYYRRCGPHTNSFIGIAAVIDNYRGLLEKYPDAVLVMQKIRPTRRNGYHILNCKFAFSGTMLENRLPCGTECGSICDRLDRTRYSDEEMEAMRQRESTIIAKGQLFSMLVRLQMKIYIDEATNRIQLYEESVKLLSFRGMDRIA